MTTNVNYLSSTALSPMALTGRKNIIKGGLSKFTGVTTLNHAPPKQQFDMLSCGLNEIEEKRPILAMIVNTFNPTC